jgi:outer membrane protein OmpU
MKNLKKLGLSALAGSLVAFSASAVEMSVSGTSEITYTSTAGTAGATGNPMGSNTSVKFSGSGNVGWADVTIVRTINDGLGSAFLSAYQTMDMGDMGTISFDSVGGGLDGLIPNDDVLPTAYEEVWNGISGAGMVGAASNDTLGYSNSFMGADVSLAYTKGGTAATGDGAGGTETVSGAVKDWHVSYTIPGYEGLVLKHGRSTTSYTAAGSNDDEYNNTHVLYTYENVQGGIRVGEAQSGTAGTAGKDIRAISVAFNINDNFAVSAATQETEYDKSGAVNVTETVDAISASYTVGAASVRAHVGDGGNIGGTSGANAEYMEISLVLSF